MTKTKKNRNKKKNKTKRNYKLNYKKKIYNTPLKHLLYNKYHSEYHNGGHNGGHLNGLTQGENRNNYKKTCNDIICAIKEKKDYTPFVNKNIARLKKFSLDVLNDYKLKYKDIDFNSFDEKLINIFSYVNTGIHNIIIISNILSLQCIILFTKLVNLTKSKDLKIEDLNFYSYDAIIKDNNWDKYDNIYENIINMRSLRGLFENNNILVLLGELTLEELLISLSEKINLVGIVPTVSWADGVLYNPFGFMCHDLNHGYNRESGSTINTRYSKPFIEYIMTHKDEYGNDEYGYNKLVRISIILFLIMHESQNENELLNKPVLEGKFDKLQNPRIMLSETYLWTDIHNLGGLLPEKIFNDGTFKKYLDDSYKLLQIEWDNYHTLYS